MGRQAKPFKDATPAFGLDPDSLALADQSAMIWAEHHNKHTGHRVRLVGTEYATRAECEMLICRK